MASPSPKSPEQSEKSKKYDRQLRLWGDHGQTALESCHVCLINATGLGTEILKSLVLPGVGAFTILDGKKVKEEDLGNNFFLDSDSIGKQRAQVATQLLLELNPEVKGDYVDESLDELFKNNPDFFSSFSVVIATSLSERELIPLSKYCWSRGIPLVVARSCGFLGYLRIQTKEHTVIESHPDTQNPDLRLDRPFPSLKAHMDSINLENMGLKEHSHTPFLVILYKALEKWSSSENRLPKTYKEKEAVREIIRSWVRLNEHNVPEMEENFDEAIKAVNYAVLPSSIPKDVEQILNDESCINLTSKSKPFWILAKAVKDFVANEGEGLLPVRGSLPDMTADTTSYIELQQLYLQEAIRTADIVHRRVQQLLHQLAQPSDLITEQDTRIFCKHASNIAVIRGSCIAEEYDPKGSNVSNFCQMLEVPDSLFVHYVMLRGIDKFYGEYNTYPGELEVEPDIMKLKGCISKLLGEWGCSPLSRDDFVHEICRYGGGELPSVSAFIGGCASQEVIKLVTNQYKPLNNTLIYDGISSNTATFTL